VLECFGNVKQNKTITGIVPAHGRMCSKYLVHWSQY